MHSSQNLNLSEVQATGTAVTPKALAAPSPKLRDLQVKKFLRIPSHTYDLCESMYDKMIFNAISGFLIYFKFLAVLPLQSIYPQSSASGTAKPGFSHPGPSQTWQQLKTCTLCALPNHANTFSLSWMLPTAQAPSTAKLNTEIVTLNGPSCTMSSQIVHRYIQNVQTDHCNHHSFAVLHLDSAFVTILTNSSWQNWQTSLNLVNFVTNLIDSQSLHSALSVLVPRKQLSLASLDLLRFVLFCLYIFCLHSVQRRHDSWDSLMNFDTYVIPTLYVIRATMRCYMSQHVTSCRNCCSANWPPQPLGGRASNLWWGEWPLKSPSHETHLTHLVHLALLVTYINHIASDGIRRSFAQLLFRTDLLVSTCK